MLETIITMLSLITPWIMGFALVLFGGLVLLKFARNFVVGNDRSPVPR